jgi:hypothetical protein
MSRVQNLSVAQYWQPLHRIPPISTEVIHSADCWMQLSVTPWFMHEEVFERTDSNEHTMGRSCQSAYFTSDIS